MEDVQRMWRELPTSQQQMIVAGSVLVLALAVLSPQVILLLVVGLAVLVLHSRLPTPTSFEPSFKQWFTEEYFPKASLKIQAEFKDRSNRSTDLLDALGSQVRGWLMGKTEKLQASVWYELLVKMALPARFEDYFVMRTATVNLGSQRRPCIVTFWGLADRWMLAPYIVVDFENMSLLEEAKKAPPRQTTAQ
mmetsp:Transcript_42278/g.76630  ORF Transcript_42278/g.76630 Transcript_42278/m.76630 type:complete len:192 (-) Transcript_42278:88-663(-)